MSSITWIFICKKTKNNPKLPYVLGSSVIWQIVICISTWSHESFKCSKYKIHRNCGRRNKMYVLSIPCVCAHMCECVHACKHVHVFMCFPTMPQVGRDTRMLLECVKKMLIAALRKRGCALLGRNHSVLVSADTLMYMDTVAADRPILC